MALDDAIATLEQAIELAEKHKKLGDKLPEILISMKKTAIELKERGKDVSFI